MSSSNIRDIIFRRATVVSGEEGATPYVADVLVSNGFIAKVETEGSIPVNGDTREIDADGLYLCPGFIDMHAHSDLYLLSHPTHEPKITQGCTVSDGRRGRITSDTHLGLLPGRWLTFCTN